MNFFDLTQPPATPSTANACFAQRVVVTPCLTPANAGQVACDALRQHLRLPRVAALEHASLVPVAYATDAGDDVALACEVFHAADVRLTVLQRRAPTQSVRGAAATFARDLVLSLKAAGARALLLALSVDHGALDAAHRRPLAYASVHVDAELRDAVARLAPLLPDADKISGEFTFSRHALVAAAELGLPLVILAVPVAEGADEADQIRPLTQMLQALL